MPKLMPHLWTLPLPVRAGGFLFCATDSSHLQQQQQEEKEEEEEESRDATLLDSPNTSTVYEQLNYTDSIKR